MMLQRASILYHSVKATFPRLSVKVTSRVSAFAHAVSCIQRSTYSPQLVLEEEPVPELDLFDAMAHSSPTPAAPVPFSALFTGMQYDPPQPTATECSSIFSDMQYNPSPPTPPELSSRRCSQEVPTPTLHVPQSMQYEQAIDVFAGHYRTMLRTYPPGLTRQNNCFIANMINSEGPLSTNSCLALANTKAATCYTLVAAHAAEIDFGGYWPSELKAQFESALWHEVGITTRSGRCFNERVEISGGRIFHAWVERVPESTGLERQPGFDGVGAGGYF